MSRALLAILFSISALLPQEDCAGTEGGSSVCLGFSGIDPDAGTLDITYSSLNPVAGFQFNLTGIDILSAESGVLNIYTGSGTGFVMGFIDPGSGEYLPPADGGVLMSVSFEIGPETSACITNPIVSGVGGVSYPPELPDCVTVPEGPKDCEGVYGGAKVVDECGECLDPELGQFGCDSIGACSCSGCTDQGACNPSDSATVNDGSCWYPVDGCGCGDGQGAQTDCEGVCSGSAQEDLCGECNGNGWDLCDDNGNGITNFDEWGYGPYDIQAVDLPDDQGGHVYLSFEGSFHDTDTLRSAEGYSIERLDPEGWVQLHSIYAYGLGRYTTVAETLADSTSAGLALTEFRVVAAMEEGNFLSRQGGSGYSVDNIAPVAPENLGGSHSGTSLSMEWDYAWDTDFNHFTVSMVEGQESFTTSASMTDELDTFYSKYEIASNDTHENVSDKSNCLSAHVLSAGQNLVGYTCLPDGGGINETMSSVDGVAMSVIGQGIASNYVDGLGWVGSIVNLGTGDGYWVSVSDPDVHIVTGECADCSGLEFDFAGGMNLLSHCCNSTLSLGQIPPGCDAAIGQGLATNYVDGIGWVGSLTDLEPGRGFWLHCTEPVDNFKWECE